MRNTGSIIAAVSAIGFLAVVFLMPTSVDAGTYGGGEVTNLALQQRQLLAAIGTAALFIAGIILHAAGALLPTAAEEAAAPEDEETMSRLGITHDAHGYHTGGFVYLSFPAAAAAAAAAAKAVQRRR